MPSRSTKRNAGRANLAGVQSIHTAITINRPIAEVWEYVSDIRNDVQWFRGIKAVRPLSAVERGAGAVLEIEAHLFGWRFTSQMRVTDFVPPGRMALLSSHSAAIHYSATYRFEPANEGAGTIFMLDAHVIAGSYYRLFGPAFAPLLRVALRRRFAVLKQVLENANDRHGQASR
jgi:hypothetical protein